MDRFTCGDHVTLSEPAARQAEGRAAKLTDEHGVVYGVLVLPVPLQLSLEAGLEEEAQGRSAALVQVYRYAPNEVPAR